MLKIGDLILDPSLVIFDKDGTLIEFAPLWHAWFSRLLAALQGRVKILGDDFIHELAEVLGYHPDDDSWRPEGPLTLATIDEVLTLIAGILYRRHIMPWRQAKSLLVETECQVRSNLPMRRLALPVGDARTFLAHLRQNGLHTAIATSDVRQITEMSLEAAGILDLLEVIICADDVQSVKPDPEAIFTICQRLNLPPSRCIMVGDSIDDLSMGRAAGVMASIGITSGANPADILAPLADVLIHDIHEIILI
ncbi:MAG: HAD family hydrolase [Anaerolineae bacterium]